MKCAHMVLVQADDGSLSCRRCGRPFAPSMILHEIVSERTQAERLQRVADDRTGPLDPPPPPEPSRPWPRCEAITGRGEQCRQLTAVRLGRLCSIHLRTVAVRERKPVERPEPTQCEAITLSGTRCRHQTRNRSHRCKRHSYGYSYGTDIAYLDTRAITLDSDDDT